MLLDVRKKFTIKPVKTAGADLLAGDHQLLEVVEKPWVDAGQLVDADDRHSPVQGFDRSG